ncbi:ABC transporter ATP-binding protein [Hydrogenophaga sp.]|uniref:ABC transporter ATP-binding protein n=1 Tax=Hydrogenophaga sp. TaxID=1904254 RepID=UPI0027273178|nr:ABC transporter ATP-binding protein [Hydrogenophaga sp.]MDO9436940.1 ABC transporter ATP-binding protein [Hydrogenophaga sp.]
MNTTLVNPAAAPAAPREEDVLLDVQNLKTQLHLQGGRRVVKVVDGVSFSLRRGETLAVIGESGCGKSMLCSSLLQVLPGTARIVEGSVYFQGQDLLQKSPSEMRQLRGKDIAMILQDPLAALDPLFTIGDQMAEPLITHRQMAKASLRSFIVALLRKVQLSSPETRVDQYPHQLSGGMLQRVVGATAISCGPSLLIADEPTTALDPTVQAQFLDVLDELKTENHLALIIVTHDLGVAARLCDRIMVMYAGKVVESGTKRQVLKAPRHPYTQALLHSIPTDKRRGEKLDTIEGQPPNMAELPPGCAFAARCPKVMDRCRAEAPPEVVLEPGRTSRCWLEALA